MTMPRAAACRRRAMVHLAIPASFWQNGKMNMMPPSARFVASVVALAAALLPAPASAEEPMTGAEFEAFTEGKTFFYNSQGTAYGIELYRPNRKVTWAFLDDTCEDGRWTEPEPGLICFVYEIMEGEQCWNFFREGDGMRALFVDADGSTVPYTTTPATQEMSCFGPDVGV